MYKSIKVFLSVAAFAGIAVALPQAAQAQNMTAFAIAGDTTPDPNITYSGGVSGIFNLAVRKGFIISKVGLGMSSNARIEFSPLTAIGAGGFQYNSSTGVYSQILKGGSFKITDNANGTVLLAGSFTEAVLHGTNGSCSMALTLLRNSAAYNTTTPLFPKGWYAERGSFSIEFNSLKPAHVGQASTTGAPSGIDPFGANDGMSFAAIKP